MCSPHGEHFVPGTCSRSWVLGIIDCWLCMVSTMFVPNSSSSGVDSVTYPVHSNEYGHLGRPYLLVCRFWWHGMIAAQRVVSAPHVAFPRHLKIHDWQQPHHSTGGHIPELYHPENAVSDGALVGKTMFRVLSGYARGDTHEDEVHRSPHASGDSGCWGECRCTGKVTEEVGKAWYCHVIPLLKGTVQGWLQRTHERKAEYMTPEDPTDPRPHPHTQETTLLSQLRFSNARGVMPC